jgi:hypothetical protein
LGECVAKKEERTGKEERGKEGKGRKGGQGIYHLSIPF